MLVVIGSQAKINAASQRSFFSHVSLFLITINIHAKSVIVNYFTHDLRYNKSRIMIKAFAVHAFIVIINEKYCAYIYFLCCEYSLLRPMNRATL